MSQRPGVKAIKAKVFRMSQETSPPMIWEAKAVDVSLHTMRLRKKNPDQTLEQVYWALRLKCLRYQRKQRGTTESKCLLDIIDCHIERNKASAVSRRKRPRRLKMIDALSCQADSARLTLYDTFLSRM